MLTFDVIADGTATSLSNTATVDNDQLAPVVSNAVTHTVEWLSDHEDRNNPGRRLDRAPGPDHLL